MGKRALLATALDRTGITGALLGARARWAPPGARLPVLLYHSIGERGMSHPFDAGVNDASPRQLDEQMAVVARYFAPVGVDELVAYRHGGRLPKNALVVTFDDGYRNNHDVALPILRKHGVRAVFFIAPWYLDERRLFWWDRIAYTLHTSTRPRAALSYPRALDLPLGAERQVSIGRLLRLVKDEPGLDLPRFLDELADAAGVPWDVARERELADGLLMTWEQVRALKAAGMDVESHTRTHRVLQTLTAAEARAELEGSRRDLEERLGSPVRAVSYPCGRPIHGEPALCAAVERAGYELGFAACGGASPRRDGRRRPLHIARQPLDADVTLPLFRGMLALPLLGGS